MCRSSFPTAVLPPVGLFFCLLTVKRAVGHNCSMSRIFVLLSCLLFSLMTVSCELIADTLFDENVVLGTVKGKTGGVKKNLEGIKVTLICDGMDLGSTLTNSQGSYRIGFYDEYEGPGHISFQDIDGSENGLWISKKEKISEFKNLGYHHVDAVLEPKTID